MAALIEGSQILFVAHVFYFVRYWVARLKTVLLEKYQIMEEKFRTEARHYEEVQHMIDLDIMKESYIVGMTTTGAARLQPLLQALKPRIGGHSYWHCIIRCKSDCCKNKISETTEWYYLCYILVFSHSSSINVLYQPTYLA
jgi:hypothetical protein